MHRNDVVRMRELKKAPRVVVFPLLLHLVENKVHVFLSSSVPLIIEHSKMEKKISLSDKQNILGNNNFFLV